MGQLTTHNSGRLGIQARSEHGFTNSQPQFFHDAPESPDQGGIVEYWRVIRRRKGLVILVTSLGALLAFLVALPQAPVYQAHGTIEIQDVNNDFLNLKQLNPVSDTTSYSAFSDIQTQIKILQSETLTERVKAKLLGGQPAQTAEATSPDLPAWKKMLNLRKSDSTDPKGSNLKVRSSAQTRLIEVLYDSTDPQYAANFINTLTGEYIDSNMEARLKMNQRTSEWMGQQLDDMRIKLEHSDDALQEYARRSGLLFIGDKEKDSVSEDRLRQVQTSLSAAQADRAAAQSRYEMARTAAPDSLPEVLGDPSLRTLLEKLTDLRREQAELLTTYTAKHDKVRRVAAQIAPLEAAFDKARASILERIRNEFETAQRRERLLSGEFSTQSHVVTGDAEKMVQYNILKREADSSRQLYDTMLQRVKEAGVVSALHASNVRIVDAARPPEKPYKPDYLLNTLLGLFGGLVGGIAIVMIRDRADRTIHEPGDIQYWVDLPELGTIPAAGSEATERVQAARSRGNAPAALGPARLKNVELMTWNEKPSPVAEAFRGVLTSILFGDGGAPPKVLVLTSSMPKEGKTTVSTNLAIALAEIQRKVLLVDADLRRPRMHTLFGLPNSKGLSTLLEACPVGSDALDECVHPTGVPNLFVLPSGPATHRAASLLYSSNLEHVLNILRESFDMVIIDTPPMLGMTDARVVAKLADAVALVVRSGKTTRDAAIAMRQRLAEDQTPVLGTILNGWNPKDARGGYYGQYGSDGYDSYKSYYTVDTEVEEDEVEAPLPRVRPDVRPEVQPAAAEEQEPVTATIKERFDAIRKKVHAPASVAVEEVESTPEMSESERVPIAMAKPKTATRPVRVVRTEPSAAAAVKATVIPSLKKPPAPSPIGALFGFDRPKRRARG